MGNTIFRWLIIANVMVGLNTGARNSLMEAERNIRPIARHAMASMEKATDRLVMN